MAPEYPGGSDGAAGPQGNAVGVGEQEGARLRMDFKAHKLKLGTLVANLHSLELLLRVFLSEHNQGGEPVVSLASLCVGDFVPVNSFTSYDSLCELIHKYNKAIKSRCPENVLDDSVVGLRDMIAHGRVLGESPSPPFTLFKCGKETPDGVRVDAKETMDEAWFSAKIAFVYQQMVKIQEAAASMGFRTIGLE